MCVCIFFFFLFLSSIIARESPIISHATVGSLAPALHLLFSYQTPSLSSLKNLFSSSPLSLSISLIPFVFQIFFIFFAPPFVLFLSFFISSLSSRAINNGDESETTNNIVSFIAIHGLTFFSCQRCSLF